MQETRHQLLHVPAFLITGPFPEMNLHHEASIGLLGLHLGDARDAVDRSLKRLGDAFFNLF